MQSDERLRQLALPRPRSFSFFKKNSGGVGQSDIGHSQVLAVAVGGVDPVGVAIVVRQFRGLYE